MALTLLPKSCCVTIIIATYLFNHFYSVDTCLTKLYVMAYTSDLRYAGSDNSHAIELTFMADGQTEVQTVPLYNLPGDDYFKNKGDLWVFDISAFSESCVTVGNIESVSIVADSNDGWNIASIVTLVRDAEGKDQLLTSDFGVNRWIDGDSVASAERFELSMI